MTGERQWHSYVFIYSVIVVKLKAAPHLILIFEGVNSVQNNQFHLRKTQSKWNEWNYEMYFGIVIFICVSAIHKYFLDRNTSDTEIKLTIYEK